MKYLATSDWQAGVTTLTLEQQEPVWHQIVDLAIEHDVAGVLHAGDLLEGPTLSTEVLAAIRRVFARLREAGIPVLLIRGNGRHDLATRDVDGIDLFHDYDGITVSQRPELVPFGGAFVVTLPWVSPKHLVASLNGASRDNVYEMASRLLVGIAGELRELVPSEGPAILMLHWSVSGASLPTGLPVDQLRDVILPWDELDALGFDAIVCGHIHKPQTLGQRGFYCGSPQPLNHGEAGAHGAWILDTDAHVSRHTSGGAEGEYGPSVVADFVTLDAPQFMTLDYNVDPQDEPIFTPGIASVQDAIVRVRYTTTRELDATIAKELMRRDILNAGAARVTIEPTIIREARARSENLTEALTERDALFAYCGAQDIGDGLRDRMMARTAEWLDG